MSLKIFAGYKTTDEPWGGANNFLRGLYRALEKRHGVQIVFVPDAACNIFFFGQTNKGPGNRSHGKMSDNSLLYTLDEIESISNSNPKAPCIMRMVNTRRHSNYSFPIRYYLNKKDQTIDAHSINAANMCDGLVFQSQYQKSYMLKQGIKPKLSDIIYNGAPPEFSSFSGTLPKLHDKNSIRILSTSVSTKLSKRHAMMHALSELEGVELFFAGTWPDDIPSDKIHRLGKLNHNEIADLSTTMHYFFHPGIKESCSNSIVEALSMGLPVLYSDGPGSSAELVEENGILLTKKNIETCAPLLRLLHDGLVENLKSRRSFYTMERAADAYYNFFLRTIEAKR